jgi:hypothetical protein
VGGNRRDRALERLTRRVRELPRVAILLLALTVAGCGGGSGGGGSERAGAGSAKQQLADYLAAFNRGDGPSACALLTPQARAGVPHLSNRINAPDCEGAIRELARTSEHLRAPQISVHVDGKRAIAKVRNKRPPYQSDVLLYKEDSGWRIAYPPALLERYKTAPGIPSDLKKKRPG